MKRIESHVCIGLFICALTSAGVWAQGTAQISGTVRDQSGAVLPGVEITATQTETGISRNTITNETGSYVLPNLAVGPYRLEAMLPGFRTHVQTGIVLQVNSNPAMNLVLEVGQVTEQVEVQANAALVETRSVGVGQIIENERILELPLNGRQVTDLITLSGAAVQTGRSGIQSIQGIPTISVAGGFISATVYVLDGAMHNNPYDNLSLPQPFPDALQEFRVETSALSAQNGFYSGAAVNSVTKSGTNSIHGDLFEFVRNDLFNARNYFATKNSTLKRHQFGGTIGGPIMRNKLFFFGGYQGTTVRQDPADNQAFVPTATMLAGDFTAITSPGCNTGRQITLKPPFVNNRIDPAEFSKAALNLAARLPKTDDACGLVTYGTRLINDEKQFLGKLDYQWSGAQSLFGRYLITVPTQPQPYAFDHNLLNTNVAGYDNLVQSYALGHTYLISPTTINSTRLTVNRVVVIRSGANFFQPPDIGVNMYSYPDPSSKQSRITVTGGFSLGANTGPTRTTSYQASEDLSLVRGSHQMSLGANAAHWRINLNAYVRSDGNFTFSGQETGLGLADFLTGKPSNLQQTPVNQMYMHQWYFGAFAADTWKLTPRLTVNYGLRWEPRFAPVARHGYLSNFDEERYKADMKTRVFKNAPAGFTYPGDPGFPGKCRASGVCIAPGGYIQWRNLAPRLGFAWDPKGNGSVSVRASYGIAYDMNAGNFFSGFISPPWTNRVILSSPPGGFDNPWQGFPGGNPFPAPPVDANAPFVPFGAYYSLPLDNPTTTKHSWNLSIQQQIATDWLVSANYIGSQTAHIWSSRAINAPIYIPGASCTIKGINYNPCSTTANLDVRRRLALLYPNIVGTDLGYLDQWETGGTQSYHGLLASIQRRAASGVTIGANYTWSHCNGDGSASQTAGGGNPGANYLDPNNRAFDRGNCEVDRRHVFNMTAVAETPQFANPKLRRLVTGWRLAGIYRKSSGSFLTITSGVDRALNGITAQRPNQILGNVYDDKSAKPLSRYLNPAAFALPPLGSNGNMGPRNIEGPGTWQFDVSLSRLLRIREVRRLEVRAEAYNLTNSFRPGELITNLNQNTFGQIRTANDPRILQFALKYIF